MLMFLMLTIADTSNDPYVTLVVKSGQYQTTGVDVALVEAGADGGEDTPNTITRPVHQTEVPAGDVERRVDLKVVEVRKQPVVEAEGGVPGATVEPPRNSVV